MSRLQSGLICALLTITWMFDLSAASPARGATLFYSDWQTQNGIRRYDLLTGTHEILVEGSGGNVGPEPYFFAPRGMVVDPDHQYLYFANSNSGAISRMNYDGSGLTKIVTGLGSVEDVAIDRAAGKLYWTDTSNDRIQRADISGQNVETIVSTGLLTASGIALDLARRRVYWADYHTDVIGSCDLDGGNRTQFPTVDDGPMDVIVDPTNDKVIWTDFATHKIYRSDLNGANKGMLINGGTGNNPGQIALDSVHGYIYWTDWGLRALRRANLDGSDVQTIWNSPGIDSLSGMAWDPIPEPGGAMMLLIITAAGMARRHDRCRSSASTNRWSAQWPRGRQS